MDMEGKRSPDCGNGSYQNPIFGGEYPDPSVVRVGADYYMTHSCFNFSPALTIWHSRDLVNWRPLCNALAEYGGNVYAPDFIYHEGLYYIYYPANKTNWVITAKDPAGPWSRPVDLKIGRIDPGHVVDRETGKRYLFLSENYIVPLSGDGLRVTGEPQKVYDGWPIPEEWSVGGYFPESPKLTWHKGYYYLTTAEGGTAGPATSHMVVMARSKSLFGPWENSPYNPVIHTWSREERWHAKGHGTLVDTPDGSWWIVYHAYEKDYYTLGRQTLLEPLEYTADGWFRSPPDVLAESEIAKPSGEAVEHGLPLSDRFSDGPLGLQWRFNGDRPASSWRLGDGLVLDAVGSRPEESGPLFCLPCDHSYEVSVTLELLDPSSEGGLVVSYDTACYYGAAFTAGTVYPLRRSLRLAGQPWKQRKISLRIVNKHNELTVYFGGDGAWNKFITGMECSGCHHNTFGGFGSVKAGLYATGGGSVRFTGFAYRAVAD